MRLRHVAAILFAAVVLPLGARAQAPATADGTLWAWGRNAQGHLDDTTWDNSLIEPAQVVVDAGSTTR